MHRRFLRFVKRGELVELEQEVSQDIHTIERYQRYIDFPIYCTANNDETCTTDPACGTWRPCR